MRFPGAMNHFVQMEAHSHVAPKKEKSPVNYLVLHDVPRTASHRDVLRALEQRSIVTKDFPLSSSTSSPLTHVSRLQQR